jgi:hypothetical protein
MDSSLQNYWCPVGTAGRRLQDFLDTSGFLLSCSQRYFRSGQL